MSPIGATVFGALMITVMVLAAGSYTKIGFSTNAWIAVNIILGLILIAYEIMHKIRSKKENTEEENQKDLLKE